ncbi:polyprenyl synthetase family protein [Solwaraspora sp. WMMA2056]|uniref:polyprenyl synthetase family protein n=1 Tax=Solwaraspora sp. WMMA2056 TaxID=3015161 RepID=UPI00259AF8E7|nr:polyprenyl synthetase family protein [Solwaraspora sp. WMMA2056]WJK41343.1 polyprenyl synthetase family protein [Solwaraspora sp. WMMA2056]
MTNIDEVITAVSMARSMSVARQDVDDVLNDTFAAVRDADSDPDWVHDVSLVRRLTMNSGKRTRPFMCHLGWSIHGGRDLPGIARVAAALELFHAFALIQDDVMDCSDVRRGMPALHVSLADRHRRRGWRGDAGRSADSAAIIWGNLCLVWADEIFLSCGLPADDVQRALPYYHRMRSEVLRGQYLDLRGGVEVPRGFRTGSQ